MMIFTIYRNSVLATLVSILGYGLLFSGISAAMSGALPALVLCLIGLPFVFLARKISEAKAQKVRERNLR